MTDKPETFTRKEFIRKTCSGLAGWAALDWLPKPPPLKDRGQGDRIARRKLGRTGLEATALGYGASRSMEPTLLLAALDHGINFIDTGRSYFNGNNERMIGRSLQGMRRDVIIQSKMRVRWREDSEAGLRADAFRKTMDTSLQASLKALRTDYIDIMLLHDPGDVRILSHEAVQDFLDTAKSKGIIRAHGFSCHNEIELLEYANTSKFYDVIMVPFNHKGSYVHMLSGSVREWDQPRVAVELKKAHTSGLGVVVMKTCSAGPCARPGEGAATFAGALRWVLDHEFIGSMAVAMSNMEEIEGNARAVGAAPG
jgi:aryl-alcohol dehydrogenase-like predicted oxidoreductase